MLFFSTRNQCQREDLNKFLDLLFPSNDKYYEKSCQIASKFVVDQNSMLIFFSTRNQCQGDGFPAEPIVSLFLNLFSPPNFTQNLVKSQHNLSIRIQCRFFFNEEPMPRRWFSHGAHCFIIVFALHLMTIHIDYASMQSTENQSYLNCEV